MKSSQLNAETTAADLHDAGKVLTQSEIHEVCHTFVNEIGGLYAVAIAPMIRAQHPDAR